MKVRSDLQQLSWHHDNVVRRSVHLCTCAHTSQLATPSVQRAMTMSHGATGWACDATIDAAHLARLRSALDELSISISSEQS